MQRPQQSIVLFMIALAIILAAGVFLVVSILQNRTETPAEPLVIPGTNTVSVENEVITLSVDTAQRPDIIDLPADQAPRPVTEQVVDTPTPPPAGQAPAPTAAPAVQPAPANTDKVILIDYTVAAGETLYSITKRIDTSISLMSEHGLSQANLTPGTLIKLPVGNPAYCPGRRPYAVREGDTAFSIARRFGITHDDLRAINNLDDQYTVRIADIICVP